MSYTITKLARTVIGLGTQTESADQEIKGKLLKVVYVEKLNDGGFVVELNDGSQWVLPNQSQAKFPLNWSYKELAKRD